MVRTRQWWVALRRPSLPQVGHGALLGAQLTTMVRTWGPSVSMACVLRWAWVCSHQHAGRISLRQAPFKTIISLSGSARSVSFSRRLRATLLEHRIKSVAELVAQMRAATHEKTD